jgi:hypothetical protein
MRPSRDSAAAAGVPVISRARHNWFLRAGRSHGEPSEGAQTQPRMAPAGHSSSRRGVFGETVA